MKNFLAKKTISGTLWVYFARYSGKLLNFITITILARLLLQDDFGVAGYALVVIGFFEITGLGIGPALIYYDKNPTRTNTAFWLAIFVGLLLFGIGWVAAPLVGAFFQDTRAVPVTQALALTFPLIGLTAVPEAMLRKDLSFKKNVAPNITGSLIKGIISVILAWNGYGAWSIIIGQLAGTASKMITYWIIMPERWWPSIRIDLSFVKPLLQYGSNIIAIEMLGVLLINIDYLIVGRYLGATALAIYTIAFRLPELLIMNLSSIVGKVLFPIYSKIKDDPAAIGRGFLTTTRYVTMLTLPMAVGLALVARPLVLVIFTAKWEDAIPVVSAIAIYSAIRSIYNDGGAFKALGKPELVTKLHILSLFVLIPALWWVTVRFGSLQIIAWAQVAMVSIIGLVRLMVTGRVLKVSLGEIAQNIQPAVLGSGVMFVAVWLVMFFIPDDKHLWQLVTAVPVGILVYGGVMWWSQYELVQQASLTLRSVLSRRA